MPGSKGPFFVSSPEQMNRFFAAAFNSGELEKLLALYEPEAGAVELSGEVSIGEDALKQHLQGLLAFRGQMVSENQYAYRVGDIALLRAKWHLVTRGEDGEPVEFEGTSSEVVRRQPDGRWLYVIDHPFGGSLA
ncbi:DUF4440 domain-containing protein [Ktedonosporobacter rubrisoli]|uniref:DUF4440 domain-containing protein n=1 Tax=Ktedonosporobacter rubrisoli TaxID=2509675 RepID=A0A4P6JV60_KTERU|nr:DUF4440 domain-containing protein [Ktedonosporobacter rubrisoli]QBD79548.1 DUF4440 domain-containing protein [Ktedonosporobacter rubrisoli]